MLDHLSAIDVDVWPGLVRTPQAPLMEMRSRMVHARLVELVNPECAPGADSGAVPSTPVEPALGLEITHGRVINRIVEAGWLGLAEGYLAGEWESDDLPTTLSRLMDVEWEPAWVRWIVGGQHNKLKPQPRAGELPVALMHFTDGGFGSWGSAQFDSGVATTLSQPINWRGHRVVVDETDISAPDPVVFADLEPAVQRRVDSMLDACKVGPGSVVCEFPASSGLLAMTAARRGATVDVITSDPSYARAVRKLVAHERLGGAIRVEVIDAPVPSPRSWSGHYDAVLSVERVETLGESGAEEFFQAIDRLLVPGGRACVQTLIDRGITNDGVLDPWRAYIWPGLSYLTDSRVRQTVEKNTGLSLAAITRMSPHALVTVQLWREHFATQVRQAAAAGIDRVYRRLWDFALATLEALFTRQELGCVQYVLEKPHERRLPPR